MKKRPFKERYPTLRSFLKGDGPCHYIGDRYELDIADGTTVERLYLDGDSYSAPMVMVREDGSSWELLNIGRDHLGSITHLATYDGILVEEYSYDAWGRLRDPETHEAYALGEEPELLLGRGFTGHEHLPWFGLVNMNARLYDPALGCFLSPDPYIQFPDFTQSFNRYSYGLNNPLVYVDENGEFVLTAGIIIGVAALIGGTINLAVNWDNCDGPGQYIAAFGVGALGGAAVAAAGPAGFWAVAGAGALSSGLISGTNNVIAQTGYNFDGFDKLDWTSVGISAAIGAASGFAGSAVGFGLYVYFNPTARQEGLNAAESAWTQVKTGVDDTLDRAKQQGAPNAQPGSPPEPVVPVPVVQP